MRKGAAKWARFAGFVGLNGLALAAALTVVVAPGLDLLRDQRGRIEHGVMLLAQAKAATARGEAVSALDAGLAEQASSRFLQGNTSSLLNADLLTRLRQAAEGEGISFSSVTSLPDRDWLDRKVVGARIEFTAETAKVAAVMSSIEDGRSFLFIRRAKLSASSEAVGRDEVTASLDVYGVTRWPST